MIIETFSAGPFDTNTYIVGCPLTKKAFVVDVPPESFDRIISTLKDHDLTLEKILLTHSHLDHIADVKPLKEATGAEVWVHSLDEDNLKKPGTDGLPMIILFEGVSPDHFFEEGKKVTVGSFELKAIFTPGHTPGGVSLYMEKEKILFSGDTLFKGTMGRIDFPTARPSCMWESLKKLSLLPKDTKVLSGHGPATEIGKEAWISQAEERFS
jgi:hydroxyacylglutathione hydrolase